MARSLDLYLSRAIAECRRVREESRRLRAQADALCRVATATSTRADELADQHRNLKRHATERRAEGSGGRFDVRRWR
jgi:hypothetical protein